MTRIIVTKCLFLEDDYNGDTGELLDDKELIYLCLENGDIINTDIERQ